MRDKQDLCQQLFETAGEALLVIQRGQIVDVNASAAALLGCSKEALLNQTLLHYSPLAQPDGCKSAEVLAEKAGAAQAGQPQRFEWLCQTSSKEIIYTEMVLSGVEFEGEAYLVASIHNISRYKQAEADATRERNLLRSLIDKLPDTYAFVKDTASRFIFTNAAHLKVIGVDHLDEVIGKTDFDFFPQELAEQYFADEQRIIQSGQPLLNIVEPGVDPAGHKKWYLTNKLPLYDENNQVSGLVGMSMDITKRKETEESLRQSQQLLQVVMDNIPQSIFWKDYNLTYLGCNRAFAEDAGLASPQEIIGKTDYELVWREQADLYRADDRRVMELGQAKLNYEEPQTSPAGTRIWLRTSKVPIRDAEDNVVAVLGMYEDITEQKRAEEVLQESERRLANIVDFLPNPTFVIDREGKVIAWNQAIEETLGVKAEDILGKGNYEYALPFYGERRPILIDLVFAPPEEIEQKYIQVRRSGETLQAEAYVYPGGQQRYYVGTAAPLYDAKGELTGAIETFRDITEQKQSELALQESEQRLADIINFLPGPTFVIDRDGKVIAWNQAIAEVTGVKAEDILGKGNYEYALPFFGKRRPLLIDLIFEPEEEIAKNYTNVRREGNSLLAENRVFPRDIERYYDLSAAGLYDSQGNLVGAIEAFRDITEQKQAEEELKKYRDRLEELVEARTVELEDRLRELNALQRLMTREGWQTFQSSQEETARAYLFDQTSIQALTVDKLGLAHNGNAQKELAGPVVAKPLVVHGEFIGALGIRDDVDDPLTAEDQAFLEAVTEQVAEALERSRLLEQTQKRAIEMEAVTQVSTVVSTILDTRQLLQEVADLTKERFGLYHAHIYLLDETGDTLRLAAGAGEIGRSMLAQNWNIPFEREHSVVAQVARARQTVVVVDVHQNPDFMPNPLLPQTRSEMAVPLMVGDKVLGVLDVQADIVGRFTGDDMQIMTTLASQVAVALQNAGQYQQTQSALAKTEMLYRVAQALTQMDDEQAMFEFVLKAYLQTLNLSQGGVLITDNDDPSYGSLRALMVKGQLVKSGVRVPMLGNPASEKVLATRKPVAITDALNDPLLEPAQDFVQQMGYKSLLLVPIVVRNQVIGILGADSVEAIHEFTDPEIALVQAIADQLGVALENKRLLAESQVALAEVERTQRRYTLQGWETYRDRLTSLSYEQTREGIAPLGDNLPLQISETIAQNRSLSSQNSIQVITTEEQGTNTGQTNGTESNLIIPLTVRGEVIGVLGLQETDEQRVWSPEEIALIEAISEQLAQAAENIRLIDESQQQAAREKRVNEIGEKIRAAQSLEEALKIAVKEVGLSLQSPQTTVKLEVK